MQLPRRESRKHLLSAPDVPSQRNARTWITTVTNQLPRLRSPPSRYPGPKAWNKAQKKLLVCHNSQDEVVRNPDSGYTTPHPPPDDTQTSTTQHAGKDKQRAIVHARRGLLTPFLNQVGTVSRLLHWLRRKLATMSMSLLSTRGPCAMHI